MTDQDSTTVAAQPDEPQPDQHAEPPSRAGQARGPPSRTLSSRTGSTSLSHLPLPSLPPARTAWRTTTTLSVRRRVPRRPVARPRVRPRPTSCSPRWCATSGTGHLEREGEVAADFLEQLLDIADMDGDIDVDVDGDRAAVAIVDSEEGRVSRRLVGPDGKVLDALRS